MLNLAVLDFERVLSIIHIDSVRTAQ